MMARVAWLAGVLALLLLGGEARAQCGSLTFPNLPVVDWQGAGGSYDVFDATEYVQSVTFGVNKKQGGQCSYVIGISTGGSGAFDPRELLRTGVTIDYNLYDSAAQSNIVQDYASGGTLISGQFSGGGQNESNTHTYYYVIPVEQIVGSATQPYEDTVTFEVWMDLGGSYGLEDSATRKHRASVSTAVELSLVDTGGAFNVGDSTQLLDFGTLTQGENQAFDLRVRGNANFDVALQSANSGVMAHTTASSNVPYTLEVDSGAVDLSSGNPVTVASFTGGTTTIDGQVYEIRVTIGSLSGTGSGTHEDNITVTVSAQ
jgi:spore coat protein U-like protein